MSKKAFDEFLINEEENKNIRIDWVIEKEKWLQYIDELYLNVRLWLNEYIESNKISLETKQVEVYEEAIGNYSANELVISIGDKIAKITPVGMILIGTRGRADLIGHNGQVKFILAEKNATAPKIESKDISFTNDNNTKNIDLIWKITSNPPRIFYTELNQETFLQCLLEVVNG